MNKLKPVYLIWATKEGKSKIVYAPNRSGRIYYTLKGASEYAKVYKENHPDYQVVVKYYRLEPTGSEGYFH